jgi:hypothetical protein
LTRSLRRSANWVTTWPPRAAAPTRRSSGGRQFAAVAAAARDRVDLGLRFAEPPSTGRLQPAKAPGQATRKISLRSVQEVDEEVRHLLRLAYEQSP